MDKKGETKLECSYENSNVLNWHKTNFILTHSLLYYQYYLVKNIVVRQFVKQS